MVLIDGNSCDEGQKFEGSKWRGGLTIAVYFGRGRYSSVFERSFKK